MIFTTFIGLLSSHVLLCCCQTEAMEAEGFQADTEDDDEDDCVIISTQSGEWLFTKNFRLQTFCQIMIFNHLIIIP